MGKENSANKKAKTWLALLLTDEYKESKAIRYDKM